MVLYNLIHWLDNKAFESELMFTGEIEITETFTTKREDEKIRISFLILEQVLRVEYTQYFKGTIITFPNTYIVLHCRE